MQIVAVDIGNSSIKIAVAHSRDDRWSWETIIRDVDLAELNSSDLRNIPEPLFWSVSSVNRSRATSLAAWVQRHRPADQFHLITSTDVELKTAVQSRDRLGRDRLIAAWQSLQINESGPFIIIDAGTAVTIDFVDETLIFQGGMIFPGAATMLRMLATQTDALPDLSNRLFGVEFTLELESPAGFLGDCTETAILLGVYQTQRCTILAAVKSLGLQLRSIPDVYLTGGGIDELLPWLPDNWHHVPDLVLQGAQNIGRRLVGTNT